jgi:addiction module RelE/StbE family toxin
MLPIVWRPAARRNWHAIIDYVSDHSPQGAKTLRTHLEHVLLQVSAHPRSGREGRVQGTREALIHTNYILVYRAEAYQIRIINVLHSARQYPPS